MWATSCCDWRKNIAMAVFGWMTGCVWASQIYSNFVRVFCFAWRMSSLVFCANLKSLTVYLQNGHKIWLSNLEAQTATITTKDDWMSEWRNNKQTKHPFLYSLNVSNAHNLLRYSRTKKTNSLARLIKRQIVGKNICTSLRIDVYMLFRLNANVAASVLVLFYAYFKKNPYTLALGGFQRLHMPICVCFYWILQQF